LNRTYNWLSTISCQPSRLLQIPAHENYGQEMCLLQVPKGHLAGKETCLIDHIV